MGLTGASTGAAAVDRGLDIQKLRPDDRVIALAGNPNVGKSTVFNSLTGMHQHTGNWPGKTVGSAQGRCEHRGRGYVLVDLPGTYSLMAHSAEEEVARDFLCFGGADGAVVVCDATCLERNLNLVLQTLELEPRTVVCVNLMDEAAKKGIRVDLEELSERLGVPVVGTCAGRGQGLEELLDAAENIVAAEQPPKPIRVQYPGPIEAAVESCSPWWRRGRRGGSPAAGPPCGCWRGSRACWPGWRRPGRPPGGGRGSWRCAGGGPGVAGGAGVSRENLGDRLAAGLVMTAEAVCAGAVKCTREDYTAGTAAGPALYQPDHRHPGDAGPAGGGVLADHPGGQLPLPAAVRRPLLAPGPADRPVYILECPGVAPRGAGIGGLPGAGLGGVGDAAPHGHLFPHLHPAGGLRLPAPGGLCAGPRLPEGQSLRQTGPHHGHGLWLQRRRGGGLPHHRLPRERLIAMLTNNFVPCNGRFPTLIAIITMFFVGTGGGPGRALLSALLLTGVIVLGVFLTFQVSRLLSATVLKGVPSSFTLELPPYRRPRVGQVIVRSVLDRTVFVLGRAVMIAAPAGLLIWVLANVQVGGASLLAHCTGFLDPLGRALGMDGVILAAFILGFPANEIVIPIMLMAYLATGSLTGYESLDALHHPADRPGLDLADGGVHHALLPGPLALLHHLHDHPQGERQLEVDPAGLRAAHGHRHGAVLPGGHRRPAAGAGINKKSSPTGRGFFA